MDPRTPSKEEEEDSEEFTFKPFGKKRNRPKLFTTRKVGDSKSLSAKREKKPKGAKRKNLKKISRRVLLQTQKIIKKEEEFVYSTPKKEQKDEDLYNYIQQANIQFSPQKDFEIRKVPHLPENTSMKKEVSLMMMAKPDPLKEISKLIFAGARRKKFLQIPAEPFRIYVENMGHFDDLKAEQSKSAINYHQPAVAVIMETKPFFHKGFVTFRHPDSKQDMIILIRRDILNEVQVFQFKSFPIIRAFNTLFCVVHSVVSSGQHITLPTFEGRVVYLGDFNISSSVMLPASNLKDKLERAVNFNFEATWEMGYVSLGVNGGSTFIDQSNRDHQAMIFAADFGEPEKKLVPNAGKIKLMTNQILSLAVYDPSKNLPFTKALKVARGLKVRAKAVFSNQLPTDIFKQPPSVWERIKSSSSPFVNAAEVKIEVLDSLRDYFQRFAPYEEKIQFSQDDYNVAFYLFSYFLKRPRHELMHSRARDRNGVSYEDILNATFQIVDEIKRLPEEQRAEKIKNLFDYFWYQFVNTKFTRTRCFLNRKKPIITEHKHLRMLSIQDSMWKFIEVIFQPVTWVCNRIAVHNIPGTFGFVSGGSTFNAFIADCPQIEETKLNEQNLNPESVSEEDLDFYLKILDEEEKKQERLGKDYDPTEFFFTDWKTLKMQK